MAAAKPPAEEEGQARLYPETLERFKLLSDLMTQIATLSSGSIVVLGTFFQDFSKHARGRGLAKVALLGFLVAIVAALVSKFGLAAGVSPKVETTNYWKRASVASFFIASIAMITALLVIVVFAFKNLG
ncbi:MAG: hypothetical protein ACRELG_12185 [Gemmataceae bacterium]